MQEIDGNTCIHQTKNIAYPYENVYPDRKQTRIPITQILNAFKYNAYSVGALSDYICLIVLSGVTDWMLTMLKSRCICYLTVCKYFVHSLFDLSSKITMQLRFKFTQRFVKRLRRCVYLQQLSSLYYRKLSENCPSHPNNSLTSENILADKE